jgi:hypothetical protein
MNKPLPFVFHVDMRVIMGGAPKTRHMKYGWIWNNIEFGIAALFVDHFG